MTINATLSDYCEKKKICERVVELERKKQNQRK